MKGAAGGPNIVKMPGGVGIRSPSRTNERPVTFTPVLAIGPMTKGYGTPVSELIIVQIDPLVARGNPFAVMTGGRTVIIVPISGTPVAPGVITTAAPIETGGPGILFSNIVLNIFYHPGEKDVNPLIETLVP